MFKIKILENIKSNDDLKSLYLVNFSLELG
jgi:hypothetical protein